MLVFVRSFVNRVYNFARVCSYGKQSIAAFILAFVLNSVCILRVFVVLNWVRVSNPQRLSFTLILDEYSPRPNPGVPHVSSHTNDALFFKAGLRFTTSWQVHHVNFFRKFRMKKEFSSQHRQTLLLLSLIHFVIAKNNEKTCWCHSNIIFEEVWRYVFAPLVVTQCWGDCSCLGLKGEIDASAV